MIVYLRKVQMSVGKSFSPHASPRACMENIIVSKTVEHEDPAVLVILVRLHSMCKFLNGKESTSVHRSPPLNNLAYRRVNIFPFGISVENLLLHKVNYDGDPVISSYP